MHGTTDGALLILPAETSEELEGLAAHGHRFVVVDPLQRLNDRVPAVSAAHTSGADQAMTHLLQIRELGRVHVDEEIDFLRQLSQPAAG